MKKIILSSTMAIAILFCALPTVSAKKTALNKHDTGKPHCDFTLYLRNPDGSTTISSGHIEGKWCIEAFGNSVRYI